MPLPAAGGAGAPAAAAAASAPAFAGNRRTKSPDSQVALGHVLKTNSGIDEG